MALGIAILWTALTLWAQYSGGKKAEVIGDESTDKKALIVYNPDPIYNLDEQVCKSFAEGIRAYGFSSKVSTAEYAVSEIEDYNLYVFCANTYNWAPDWQIANYIKNHPKLKGKSVVAITLGSGSTKEAKEKLEHIINATGANLLSSETYWLMRPNDEKRLEENNVDVANDMAKSLGEDIGKWLSGNLSE